MSRAQREPVQITYTYRKKFLDLAPLIYRVCAVVVDVMAAGTDAMMTLLAKDLIRT